MAIRCCNGCVAPKRYPGCKANCSDYAIDNAFHQAEKAENFKKAVIEGNIMSQRSDNVYKAVKSRRRGY